MKLLPESILGRMILLNRFLAEFIDNIGLFDLHRDKSICSHFKNLDTAIKIEDFHNFYKHPQVPEIKFIQSSETTNYTLGEYSFNSEISDNGLENSVSKGSYYRHKNNEHAPNIIFVHGWRMNSLDKIDNIYLKSFLELGYNMYYFTLPHHFSRTTSESSYNGELMVSADIDRTLLSVKQAVTDLRALICWLKANCRGKVIVIGISLGGFITNLTGAIEEKIDALVSVMYANSIAYSVWNTLPGKYIKKDFLENGFTEGELKEHWAITNPGLLKPAIPKDKILLMSGMYDQYVVKEDTNFLWEAWGRPKRILYPCGHAGIIFYKKKICEETISFLKKIL